MKTQKMDNTLELRMYGLVPYNISPIQQGIQFGHGVVEYGLTYSSTKLYLQWAYHWKTFIILNGGTTNNNPNCLGTLNSALIELRENNVPLSTFNEPDLGDQLTAICFIVDERVFNKVKYPDYNLSVVETENEYYKRLFNTEDINTLLYLRLFLKDKRLA